MVELGGVLFEYVKRTVGREVDHVGGDRIQKVSDRVVGLIEHALDVCQLEEEHQANGEQCIVGSTNVANVDVGLIGDDAQLVELKCIRHLATRVVGL